MAALWRIPSGPNGKMVETTDFELVREFFQRFKKEKPTGVREHTSAPKARAVAAVYAAQSR